MATGSESEDDFVCYGTPLDPLEEDEPRRRPLPLREQTVKDDKGRFQRFHGAFTGGFCAGYFNTVGSKEGWTPSTFVSSRHQKAEKQNARPEDFMDQEDFGEYGIAPQEITTSLEFSSGRTDKLQEKAQAVSSLSALIPGNTVLEELIKPARSLIGVELLRRMGWKEGQGVGPRVAKRKPGQQKTDGVCVLPSAGSEDSQDDDDEFAPKNVTFAPKDVTPIDFTPKVDQRGLGYCSLDPGRALLGTVPGLLNLFSPESEHTKRLFGNKQKSTQCKGVAGQAFGVGALEDDDDDIYQRDNMSTYDHVLGGEEPGDGLFGWTAPQQYKKTESSRDTSYLGKILEGFALASKVSQEKTVFPPPVIPKDFCPVHSVGLVFDMTRVSPGLAQVLQASRGHLDHQGAPSTGRHQLDAAQRRAMLGETALRGPSSVFELLSSTDRDRLKSLSTSSKPPIDSLISQHASGPVGGSSQAFKPFENNPSKQARYDQYLNRFRLGQKDALEGSLDPCMTEWERSREGDEFSRAALLYKPSTSSLASRFTRAKLQEDQESVANQGDVDDKQAAVQMKMFGKFTRNSFSWYPDKLLCKRFNVPDPYPESGMVGLPRVKRDKFSVFNFLPIPENPATTSPSSTGHNPSVPEPEKKSRWDVSVQILNQDPLSVFLSETRIQTTLSKPDSDSKSAPGVQKEIKQEEEEEEEEETRPPMDLFKEIFANSSDDKSSSSSDSEEEEDEEDGRDKMLPLFSISCVHTTATVTESDCHVQDKEEFGPKLPPPCSAIRIEASCSSHQKEHKDHTHKEKKQKKKKKKKSKEEKKKKEKRRKKGRRHKKETSYSSSEEDTTDGVKEVNCCGGDAHTHTGTGCTS